MTWLTNMITQIKNPVLIMITQAPHLKSEKLLAFSDFTFVLYPHTTNVKSEKDIFVSRWESVGTLNTAVKARAERNYHLAWLTIIKKKQVIHPNITNQQLLYAVIQFWLVRNREHNCFACTAAKTTDQNRNPPRITNTYEARAFWIYSRTTHAHVM